MSPTQTDRSETQPATEEGDAKPSLKSGPIGEPTPRARVASGTEQAAAKPASTDESSVKASTQPRPVAETASSPKSQSERGRSATISIPQEQAGPPSGQPAETQALQPNLQTFESSRDGFSFANFSGGTGSASILVDDLVELFGADGLCLPGRSRCTPYPGVQLFLEQLNGVLANGLCYGISASVTNHFSGDIRLGDFDRETADVVDLIKTSELEHSIAKLHMMQFSEEYRASLDTYIEMRPEEIAEELHSAFGILTDRLTPPYTLALYSTEGGHSITPIRVEDTDSGYRVFVYDSNWPKETRWVDIDSNNSSWSYQAMMEDKDSPDELWMGQGPGSMALIPHIRPDDGFHCFFCQSPGLVASKATGSVIMVNARDMRNLELEMSSKNGETISWTSAGRLDLRPPRPASGLHAPVDSAGVTQVKTYLLPSANGSENSGGDTLLVFVPIEVYDFKVDLTLAESSDQTGPFGLILSGPDIPTIVAEGSLSYKSKENPGSMLEFYKDYKTETVVVAVDSESVETIQTATYESTTFVEPTTEERYEATVVEGNLDDVKVMDKETTEVMYSLKTTLQSVENPLRSTETGSGLIFFKFSDGSVKVKSPDGDIITKALDAGYQVSYSDGTTASFGVNPEGAMVGVFSDGSTSIRFEGGSGIHSTADGWIIDEREKGVFEVFRESVDGVFGTPSVEDLDTMTSMAQDAKEMMRSILEGTRSSGKEGVGSEGSATVGSAAEEAMGERWDTMAEKLGFLEQVNGAVSENTSDGVSMDSVLSDMLELMQEPAAVPDDASRGAPDMTSGDMPDMSSGDMPDMTSGDMPDMSSGDMPDMSSGDMPDMSSGDMPDMDSGDMPDMDSGDMDSGDMDSGDMDSGDMDSGDMDSGGM